MGLKDIIVKGSIFAVLSAVFCAGGAGRGIETVRAEEYCAEVINRGSSYTSVNDAIYDARTGDTVRLLKDVIIDSPLNIENEVILDLNGHAIDRGLKGGKASDDGYVIFIDENGKLTLTDSSDGKTGLITGGNGSGVGGVYSEGEFCMEGGRISGNTGNTSGGGVHIYGSNGKFHMKGGTISGNTSKMGGGVLVDHGEFLMEGGTISGNIGIIAGGGVFVESGRFRMEGGTISGNTSETGGGVRISDLGGPGVFTMNGGKITLNSAKDGGGAYIGFNCEFNMTGGMITYNTAANTAGGFYIDKVMCLSGSAEIYGNTCGGTITNDVLTGGTPGNVCIDKYNEDSYINITGEMKNKTPIGITLLDNSGSSIKGVFAKADENYTGGLTADDVAHFEGDKEGYAPKLNKDGKAELTDGYHLTVINGTESGYYAEGVTVRIKPDDPEEGRFFLKWRVLDGGVSIADEDKGEASFVMPAKEVKVEAVYEDIPKVSAPVFSPSGGTFTSAQNVTITSETEGADIYYTVDGSTPTKGSIKYTGPVSVTKTTTIKAIAVRADMLDSEVSTSAYTIEKNPGKHKHLVTVNKGTGGGEYAENETVTIEADDPAEGKVFDKWTSEDGVVFSNAASPKTTFKMPGKDVTVTASYKDKKEKEEEPDPEEPDPEKPEQDKSTKKVPISDPVSSYTSPEDNFAHMSNANKITKLQLDFSKVKESGVAPDSLRMTVIKGSKLTTVSKIGEGGKVEKGGGVKVKVNKKRIAIITCRSDGWVRLPMEDGVTYTVNFLVETPKAKKLTLTAGSGQVIKTIKDLFCTTIDSGTLTATPKKNASRATVSADNTLVINPDGKDTIKVRYKYLNKKYKLNIKVK